MAVHHHHVLMVLLTVLGITKGIQGVRNVRLENMVQIDAHANFAAQEHSKINLRNQNANQKVAPTVQHALIFQARCQMQLKYRM